jgi:3-oxoacyl-[acyl-carrier protein] reductase
MKQLEGKVALITGGSRGIGEAIVRTFVAEGAAVAFTYVGSVERAQRIIEELTATGAHVQAFQADVRDAARAQEVVDETVRLLGRLDTVVNNAGITRDNLILRMSDTDWQDVLDSNLTGVFNYTRAASKVMLRQRSGAFINLSSIVGVTGNAGQANYAASKAGLIGFTKSVAKELATRKIRANVVAPGFIQTEMTEALDPKELEVWLKRIPLGRAGTPEEVARLCVFLASDWAAYITGQVVLIDGGMA